MMGIIKTIRKVLFKELKTNSLTVVGVGPGDSSLLTIRAINALKNSDIIFCPISDYGKKSYAAQIVKKYIRFKKRIPILFPMAREGYDPNKIWRDNAERIIYFIKNGRSVALLCLGDTSIYASSRNIILQIKKIEPAIIIENIPGISSISAAASLTNFDLVKQGETLKIIECPDDPSNFYNLITKERDQNKVLVIMKLGSRWTWVKNILQKENIINKSILAINIGLENQFIGSAENLQAKKLPYFSLVFVRF